MDFKTWLSKEKNVKTLDISDEYFVHFTTEDRAKQILKSNKLLIKPPYEKFGTDTVDAVSTMLGVYVPNVQTNHIKKENPLEKIVAVRFQTSVLPVSGYPEEVKWDRDVKLINPKIISEEEAISMLLPKDDEREDYKIKYT